MKYIFYLPIHLLVYIQVLSIWGKIRDLNLPSLYLTEQINEKIFKYTEKLKIINSDLVEL